MKITELVYCKGKDDFLKQIENCDWAAAKFLTELIKEEKFEQTLGGWAKLYLLIENEKLISFITLSAQDCVVAPDLSPALWLVFFHFARVSRTTSRQAADRLRVRRRS